MSENSVSSLKSVEEEYADFIKERIQKSGGSIQFQHLTGHLSQLNFRLRESIGTSKSELMKFIRKHKNVFSIDEHGIVTINSSSNSTSVQKEKSKNSSYDSSSESGGSLPLKINDGEGIVIRIFPMYGFITAQKPFKTSVYFQAVNFNDKEKTLLTDFDGLFVGRKVFFNAVRGNQNFESKYRATSVWFAPVSDDEEKPTVPKTRKKRETGLYDGNFLDGFGEIQKIFPSVGFIIIDGDVKNTVFFHRQHLLKYKNVTDLGKVLKKGDVVNFKAIRSTKKDARARWEATQVWLRKEGNTKLKNGDLESDLDDMLDVASRKSSTRNRFLKKENGDLKSKCTPRMIKSTPGKINPNNKGTVITFGKNFEELADADSSLFYVHGNQVTDVCWEFSDGQDVYFDAVEIKSAPYWKAVLVWVGDKPDVVLPTCVGDFSAFMDEDEDDDIPESGSYTSKASEISVLSEVSIDSSSKKSEDFKQSQRPHPYANQQKLANKSFSSEMLKCSSHSSRASEVSASSEASFAPCRKSKEQKYPFSVSGEKKKPIYTPHSDDEISNYKMSSDSTAGLRKSDLVKDKLTPSDSEENVENFENFSYCDSSAVGHSDTLNWGDTPYPDEESSENLGTNVFEDCNRSVADSDNCNNENNQQEMPNIKKDLLSVGNKFITAFESKEAAHDLKEGYASIVMESDLLKEPAASESEKKASIKCFQNIDGKITKVYHRYAEMENSLLKKPAAFFWNELYRNGVSVLDHFDDLREVLKIGDIVKFDCFEIVDDFGEFCQKVTVVWSGPKPKIELMTPEQYIIQNNLSVTVVETKADEKQDEVISESMRLLNKESEAPRKFLSVVYSDEVGSDTEPSLPNAEMNVLKEGASLFPYQENAAYNSKHVSEPKEINYDLAPSSISNRKQLIETVCEMMEYKRLFSTYSKDTLSIISSDIVNFILNTSLGQASVDSSIKSSSISDKGSQTDVEDRPTNTDQINVSFSDIRRTSVSERGTQTIITGEIIAQSIFTQ